MSVEIRVAEEPAAEAGALLAAAAREGGAVALSGGRTAGAAYRAAAGLEPDWHAAEVWFGDERAVPPDDERSNYRLVCETLLDGLAVAPGVHRVEGELGAEEAADRYDALVRGVELRFALNGIGADGHTASLFPHAPGLRAQERRVVAAEPRIEPLVPRVTMTPPVFAGIGLLVYLATGAEKADAVARAFAGEPDEATPASIVRGRRTIAVLDLAAAALLPGR